MTLSIYPRGYSAIAAKFEEAAHLIRNEYNRKKLMKGLSPFDSKWGSFKTNSYRIITLTKSEPGGHTIIKNNVRTSGREPARLDYLGNEFHWGLVAICGEDDILSPKKLYLFSRQMAYAEAHIVPARYLVGFLYQSGSAATVPMKLKTGAHEPWFGTL